jgi:pyruvate,water dikinase
LNALGGKAAALAAAESAGLPVPPWFAVSGDAGSVEPSAAERAEIAAAVAELCPDGAAVAVRSSARDEDGAACSFAGQLESFLFVPVAQIARRVADVRRSGFSERVRAYRREHGLSGEPPVPTVLVQRMVNADAAGVAFSADPVSGRRGSAVVSAVFGLGSALVNGETDADVFHVDRAGRIVERHVGNKALAHRRDAAGGVRVATHSPAEAVVSALTDEQVAAVAALARRAECVFGRPQDIEWAFEDGRLYLLQSRPVTALAGIADPDGVPAIWDNANIAESYNGVTTPLTFSFARRAYEEVYRRFCRIMGVSAATIDANAGMFRRMLGLVRGRIYYNLLNWYRLIALLPGFSFNRPFMEQMMGVREGLPPALAAEFRPPTLWGRLRDGFRLLRTTVGMVVNHFTLPRRIRKFQARLDEALGPRADGARLEDMRLDELAAHYRDLERSLLTNWDAPLVNDFFAMIFFGALRRMTGRLGDADGTLHNDLLCGQSGIISTEPARRVRAMAAAVADDPAFVELLGNGPRRSIEAAMPKRPALAAQYAEYLAIFGDRCLEELKLESPTLHDDPLPLLRAVAAAARNGAIGVGGRDHELGLRAAAEVRVRAALRFRPLRRMVFNRVAANARARVRDRENLRFERTRVFGRVRRIFAEMGRRLAALDVLDDARDVFHLEVEEVLGFVEGTSSSTALRALAAARKAEFARYRAEPAPADRFETRGAVHAGNDFADRRPAAAEHDANADGTVVRGLGCCPGVVRGPACVVLDPRGATVPPGAILVAERTDPGWIALFASAAGIVVERGSLLSHSAIVAREMGIPAVVSAPGATSRLRDGEWVELDGAAGTVRPVAAPAEAAA